MIVLNSKVPNDVSIAANGMTAIFFPEGITGAHVIAPLFEHGVVVAGGLHRDIKDKYFRVGHMGVSAMDTTNRQDLETVKKALRAVLNAAGYANQSKEKEGH